MAASVSFPMTSITERKEVSACLNALLKRLRITADVFETSSDFGKGVNYTGDIVKLCIKGRHEDGKRVELRLFLKIAIRDVATRTLIAIEQAYQCETFMYETLFSYFAKMQTEAKIENRFESYPKYYASSTKNLHEILVLEDMTSYQVIDRARTLTYPQALVLTKEVGKFHALSLVLRKRNPEVFQEMCKNIRTETMEEDEYYKLMRACMLAWIPRYLALLDPELHRTAYEKFCGFAKGNDEIYHRYYAFDPEDEHGVIGHCDIWATNLLFDEQKVCIIDWQTSRVCSPAVDLSQILFTCCDYKVRGEHGHDLIRAYYDSCSAHLHQFGEDPDSVFPFSALQKHLKEYSAYALCLALRTVLMLSVLADDIPDPSMAQNYSELAEMFCFARLDTRLFNERGRAILVDYTSYGYDL